jgi:hypothetical protein
VTIFYNTICSIPSYLSQLNLAASSIQGHQKRKHSERKLWRALQVQVFKKPSLHTSATLLMVHSGPRSIGVLVAPKYIADAVFFASRAEYFNLIAQPEMIPRSLPFERDLVSPSAFTRSRRYSAYSTEDFEHKWSKWWKASREQIGPGFD